MKPDSMDAVFQALANATRRRILDVVKESPGCRIGDVAARFDMSRIGVMKHIRILEEAGLLISEKQGRTRRLSINAAPIRMINDRWLSEFSQLWGDAALRIKYAAEAEAAASKSNEDQGTHE